MYIVKSIQNSYQRYRIQARTVKAVTALDTAKANLVRPAEAREVIDRGPGARKASQLRLHALKSSAHVSISSACEASDAKRAGGGGQDTRVSAMKLEVRPQLWARVAAFSIDA